MLSLAAHVLKLEVSTTAFCSSFYLPVGKLNILWLSPVSISGTSNQLDRRCVWRNFHSSFSHSLESALTMKPKRRRSVKMVSFSLAIPRMCFRKVSSELDRSFNGENMVFGSELEAEHGLTENLCDFLVGNGLEENRNRIHFLEERNEEMLSKRLLKLSRLNKVRSALELFDSMRVLGLQPNAHACNSFLSYLLRNGNLQKVFIVFEFMRKKENVTGHTYSLLLKAIAEVMGCDSKNV